METLVIILAFWLILVGVYGAVSLLREQALGGRPTLASYPSRTPRPARPPRFSLSAFIGGGTSETAGRQPRPDRMPPSAYAAASDRDPAPVARRATEAAVGRSSEVDRLRAQVEHLRSELYAISKPRPQRLDRPRMRRYSPGVYTYLPRLLRRHVREARHVRRPRRA